jgi:hypothetical protein
VFVVINNLREFAATILLAVGAILPIVDPLIGWNGLRALLVGAFPNAAS